MGLISQFRRQVSELTGKMDMEEIADADIRAYDTLQRIEGGVSKERFERLTTQLMLAEVRAENNYFSGYLG